jgi:hypothetical protein
LVARTGQVAVMAQTANSRRRPANPGKKRAVFLSPKSTWPGDTTILAEGALP